MNTPRNKSASRVTREIVRRRLLADEPFVLADIGVSGGLAIHWREFEPDLCAFGFDPLVRECERLNRAERNPKVRYFDRYIGWDGYRALFPDSMERDAVQGWTNQPFPRTSAARLQHAQAAPVDQYYNSGDPKLVYTSQRVSLDAFFKEHSSARVDFLKIDTDGHDYEVLCGARQVLEEHQVLGLLVETQFHGVSHPHSNLFSNIDRLLREHGFSLFDLEAYRYTRGVLPGHFVYRLPAQTREGQILAGDALYLRDAAAPGYEDRWRCVLSESKLLKLVCLFEKFGLADCAAELLELKREALTGKVDVPQLLDLLAAELYPGMGSYGEVNRRFRETPERFYPAAPGRFLRRVLPRPLYRLLSAARRKFHS